jgi:inner membrane protein
LNKQESIILRLLKPTAFIILWNANVATTASYLLADYSLDSQSITFTTYNKNKALESQLSGNSDFEKLKKAKDGISFSKK